MRHDRLRQRVAAERSDLLPIGGVPIKDKDIVVRALGCELQRGKEEGTRAQGTPNTAVSALEWWAVDG